QLCHAGLSVPIDPLLCVLRVSVVDFRPRFPFAFSLFRAFVQEKLMMTCVALALKNLRRRPLRTTLTVGGVALAVAVLYSLCSFQKGYQLQLRAELQGLGAHILVVPKGCPYEAASIAIHGANWPRYLRESDLPA